MTTENHVTNIELPELPDPYWTEWDHSSGESFTHEQMRAYGLSCYEAGAKAERERAELDAKRYRFIRDQEDGDSDICPFYAGEDLDAAIDAAMQEKP